MRVGNAVIAVAAGLIGILMLQTPVWAGVPDDKAALAELKSVKVVFDLKDGDARAMLYRLNIIDETRQSLINQGVKPEFILTFRGQATKLVQTDLREIKPEDRPVAIKIAAKLAEMGKAPGVQGFDQCAVAIRDQGTKADLVLPEIRVVGNAWISLMAYQARGYAYIAP